MGMFDGFVFTCSCGKDICAQTKQTNDPCMREYRIGDVVPVDEELENTVLALKDNCECGARFALEFSQGRIVRLVDFRDALLQEGPWGALEAAPLARFLDMLEEHGVARSTARTFWQENREKFYTMPLNEVEGFAKRVKGLYD